ncbi:MAG: ACT domain-containing protein [Rhodanobacteraceae bacterium]|nr:ACT domain-containing protein [Rhodanobacteraceae bacterium]MBK7044696.1 ACT domain-containing protein [Rhodanobacteraceae bacterium]MBP9153586.1 ACT domain-containing protein [Xanthomonadales bacterium]HQW82789.1 ACT domain-containing protein [Pseudomonadota bacterium]
MNGETQLTVLLRTLSPVWQPDEYVYATLPTLSAELNPVLLFREAEGWTHVLRRDIADAAGIDHTFTCAWFTLCVHSSLKAVGLTAAVADALANAGIACNAVAAYHHDHLFLPLDRAAEALEILQRLSRS